jgi:hypothetical protein
MPTAPASRIPLLTPARPGLFTIAATSLIAVPSALHAMAPRRVACEFPGGIVLRSLYPKKKEKKSSSPQANEKSAHRRTSLVIDGPAAWRPLSEASETEVLLATQAE